MCFITLGPRKEVDKLQKSILTYTTRVCTYKALRICNVRKRQKICSKILYLSKPLEMTETAYHSTEFITAVTTVIIHAPGVDLVKLFGINLLALFVS
jgi:hypothetical protein